ncbi:hypothetical protein V8C34DRAFT_299986 [Trichoderma compactum]
MLVSWRPEIIHSPSLFTSLKMFIPLLTVWLFMSITNGVHAKAKSPLIRVSTSNWSSRISDGDLSKIPFSISSCSAHVELLNMLSFF